MNITKILGYDFLVDTILVIFYLQMKSVLVKKLYGTADLLANHNCKFPTEQLHSSIYQIRR